MPRRRGWASSCRPGSRERPGCRCASAVRRRHRVPSRSPRRSPPDCIRSTTRCSIDDGNLYRHLQRHARPAGAGLDLPRPAGRHARNVFLRHRQPDVDGDRAATAALYVSSRFEGTVYRLQPTTDMPSRSPAISASPAGWRSPPMGRCSSAIVRARSSAVDARRPCGTFAALPPSVAAFHLALGPDDALYVTGPTLSPYDVIYRIDALAARSRRGMRDSAGRRVSRSMRTAAVRRRSARRRQRPVSHAGGRRAGTRAVRPGLVGLAFEPRGGLVVCSNDTAYRLPATTIHFVVEPRRTHHQHTKSANGTDLFVCTDSSVFVRSVVPVTW